MSDATRGHEPQDEGAGTTPAPVRSGQDQKPMQERLDLSEDGNPTVTSPTDFEVLLVTGMSGAGRTHAADALEDMGWYVVDNLPPNMLIPLVDMMTSSDSAIRKLCAVIDVRSQSYFRGLSRVLAHLEELGVKTRILFLDCSAARARPFPAGRHHRRAPASARVEGQGRYRHRHIEHDDPPAVDPSLRVAHGQGAQDRLRPYF